MYQRLTGCVEDVRRIAELSGLQTLSLEIRDEDHVEESSPSDVYDIASLLVSELAWLHAQNVNLKPARRVVYPGKRLPAHVFQRAGILENQLGALQKQVAANPMWLVSGADQ